MDVSLQANSTQTRGNGKGERDPKERGKGLGWGSFFCRAQIAVPGPSRVQYGVEDGTAFQGPSDSPPVPTRTRVRAQCLGGPAAAPPSCLPACLGKVFGF